MLLILEFVKSWGASGNLIAHELLTEVQPGEPLRLLV